MKLSTFKEIVRSLHEADVRYIVVGGMAVVAHGYGRLTYDLDIVVQLNSENVVHAFNALKSIGYVPRVPVTAEQFGDKATRQRFITEKNMTVLSFFSDQHPETTVDMFVTEPFDFESCYAGSYNEEIDKGIMIHFIDVQTLITMKQIAGRDKDKDDIAHLRMMLEESGDEPE